MEDAEVPRSPAPPAPERPIARHVYALRSTIEVLAQTQLGLATQRVSQLISGGGNLRLSVGAQLDHGFVGAALGVGGFAPMEIPLSTGSARLDRLPFDLSLRGTYHFGRIELGGDVGLSLAVLFIRGQSLTAAQDVARLEAGLRLGVLLRVWIRSWIAATAGLENTIVPSPYGLAVVPEGTIARLPADWFSATLGVVLKIH